MRTAVGRTAWVPVPVVGLTRELEYVGGMLAERRAVP